jgi:hypothetical protein
MRRRRAERIADDASQHEDRCNTEALLPVYADETRDD